MQFSKSGNEGNIKIGSSQVLISFLQILLQIVKETLRFVQF